MNKDLIFFPASLLAQGIRLGVFSARDVFDAYMDQIKKRNPELNAIVTLDEAGSRRQAIEADEALAQGQMWGPLHGVPVTVQDSLDVKEMRSTQGNPAFANHIAREDAPLVARLRKAGAIVMGKTNVSSVGRGAATSNPVFGTTHNPWNPALATGAGGGGGAAAVAAGLTALDFGVDVGGSLRTPAALCGVFGFKITAGRVPSPENDAFSAIPSFEPLSAPGPLARSIQDLSLAYSALAASASSPEPSYPERKFKERRIAWTDELGDVPVGAEVKAALQEFAGALARQGAKVERQSAPGLDLTKVWGIGGALVGGLEAPNPTGVSRLLRRFFGQKGASDGPGSAILQGLAAGPELFRQRETLEQLVLERRSISSAFDRFFTAWDVWICPVFPIPAISGSAAASDRSANPLQLKMDVDGHAVSQAAAGLAFNLLFSLTGNPVIVFPVALSKEGLPIGAQMVGRRGMEADLLALAETITEIGCGYQRPPRLD